MTYTKTPPRAADHARGHLDPASILLMSAALSVIVGGLVAAVAGPLGLAQGSWLAAYLVLVCGVGGWGSGPCRGGPLRGYPRTGPGCSSAVGPWATQP